MKHSRLHEDSDRDWLHITDMRANERWLRVETIDYVLPAGARGEDTTIVCGERIYELVNIPPGEVMRAIRRG